MWPDHARAYYTCPHIMITYTRMYVQIFEAQWNLFNTHSERP